MNGSPVPEAAAPRQFKKHRVLPRPHNDQAHDGSRRNPHLTSGAPVPRSSTPHPILNSQPLKHQLRRIGTGPDLPPTPPAHSNASSSSQSAAAPSPTSTEDSVRLLSAVANRPPATPPDQRSPPTPDVTPPHPSSYAKVPRPSIKGRNTSGSTMGPESRAESFITAREEVTSSEDEAGRAAGWRRRDSIASQTTVTIPASAVAIDDDAARTTTPSDRTPTNDGGRREGDGTPKAEAQAAEHVDRQGTTFRDGHSRDARLSGVIMSQQNQSQRRSPRVSRPVVHHEAVIQDKVSAAPTDATKAVRNMRLDEAAPVTSSPKNPDDQKAAKLAHPQAEAAAKRDRPLSTSSQATSIVEVVLVDGPPKRERKLRHMRKQSTLRKATDNREEAGLMARSEDVREEASKVPKVPQSPKLEPYDRESQVSTVAHSVNPPPISSRTARREIWKSGAIPVVIVPDRRSSRGPKSREPSLRSTSSKHSGRSKSIKSVSAHSPSSSASSSSGPVFERPARRSRAYSESDGSVRTMDFPPTIPQRSSSLSAPTSRNISRAGSVTGVSVTASSVKVHVAEVEEPAIPRFSQEVHIISPSTPSLPPASPEMKGLEREETVSGLGIDQHDDVLSVKKIPPLRNTPFSVASMDTCATAPELSEALAIQMFPHQNSSVVMVDHSTRPSETASAKRLSSPPNSTMAHLHEQKPATPLQRRFSSPAVDSPLRNPRAPPQPPSHPPAINFIPATPSGMTPAAERAILQGNYFESLNEKPPRRASIVRRAFSRRRHSIDYVPTSRGSGFLARAFSLSRRNRDDSDISLYRDNDKPTEEDKLHPFWRPQWISDDDSEPWDDDEYRSDDEEDDDEVYRYPPVDNRPRRHTRSFGQKVRETLSLLPSQEYHVDDVHGPQRRTIRRTSSGNLRIVRRKVSSESMRRRQSPGWKMTNDLRYDTSATTDDFDDFALDDGSHSLCL
ncbi:hypothetical protein BBK36DRAFT_1194855 [Trichoderma citrinoviride]|uniref:Uncharacterized protein n=1 Tax=Trichoderma citrinoviride TaxID=58853 RepID=A0A2T4BFJ6_9HYPO|nr:hypothetical protein BBK36DRAFT_1194855 [Trichoderma citrinoviride]PTB68085.1 hypothetical protein BBK36DRAFT_1194855 [Trichoderma citrinoviride]